MSDVTWAQRKRLGAFYTDPLVVRFLIGWGLKSSAGTVMDPSCGDGRFLLAAAEMGAAQVIGCDLDPNALTEARTQLGEITPPPTLIQSDFFTLNPQSVQPVDLIVGNPPFIRYQRFTGETRRLALKSARRIGARLTQLTASWAPFLLHAIQFLNQGGAMAVVVPAEIVQTDYGVQTLRALCRNFEHLRFVSFQQNFFADAQEETFLLLAEGFGGQTKSVELIPLESVTDLECFESIAKKENPAPLNLPSSGPMAFAIAFLSQEEKEAWPRVATLRVAASLGNLGTITNGYVTGANSFFHRTLSDAVGNDLPADWLRPTARNSRSLRGLTFTAQDVVDHEKPSAAHHLIVPERDDVFNPNPEALARFVADGERHGIHQRFKCRNRHPWWRVPGLIVPDVLLPYMIGATPRASVNTVRAVYTNTLHGIRLGEGISAERLAFAMYSTFTLLSMELEGRSYGGGVLKLEPSEMQRVRVILPTVSDKRFREVYEEVDQLLRQGNYDDAVHWVDEVVLGKAIGLDQKNIELLRSARNRLVQRRMNRHFRFPPVLCNVGGDHRRSSLHAETGSKTDHSGEDFL